MYQELPKVILNLWISQMIGSLMEKLKMMTRSVTSRHLLVFMVPSLITFDACVRNSTGQQQQHVQFLPINDWNCSGKTEKMCAVDLASDMLQTSSLTECSMQCWIKSSQCLQFNYYQSSSSLSSNCALYDFHPARYIISTGC